MSSIPNQPASDKAKRPTPERIMQMLWAFAPPILIHAGVETGIFDSLDRSPKSPPELAADLDLSERGAAAVLGGLLAVELVSKASDGRFHLAPDAQAFLVRGKPQYQGGLAEHIQQQLIGSWMKLAEVTRTGMPATQLDGETRGSDFFEVLVPALFPMNYPAARALAQAMDYPALGDGKSPVRVLDIAAGSGVWGIAQAEASPRVRVTALDMAPVLEVTRKTVEGRGLAHSFEYLAGDLRSANFGRDYSVITLGHILHSEGEHESRKLLGRCFDALAPGGTVAIAEFVVNADRTGPPMSLLFAVNMLVHTAGGNTFSFEEMRGWLEVIGFEHVRTLDIHSHSPLILADKPKAG